jgi:hypothetical protein
MKQFIFIAVTFLFLTACSSKVMVKKDTCKEVYGGTLMECEKVSK